MSPARRGRLALRPANNIPYTTAVNLYRVGLR